VRPRSLVAWSLGLAVVALIVLSSLGVFSSTTTPKGTVVSSITTARYGPVLVVGGSASGGLYRFPLYEFSGDVGKRLGCGTNKTVAYDLGAKESVPLTCTGPERDLLADVSSDDWPALTTRAKPIAGHGVDASLLGTINRPGIGRQITYGGHPLYLFDPSSQPFAPQGENFMETVKPLPPWHGYWYLASARTGAPSPGVATLRIETLPNGHRALATQEDGNVDPILVSLYSNSAARGPSKCDGDCAEAWSPLLTSAPPHLGPGVNAALVGVVGRADGNYQVTYDHRPLYLYDDEVIRLNASDRLVSSGSAGNGADERGPGGVMGVVALSK
jgi:predicted lipoprotein with Yx(FWY)xxD motif